jgi:hypothetical protein
VFDLSGRANPVLRYARWWNNDDLDGDPMDVEISNDGGMTWHWIEWVANVSGGWEQQSVYVTDYVAPLTDQMRFRVSVRDVPNNSKDEAGIDAFEVFDLTCAAPGDGDFDGDGDVDLEDGTVLADCLAGPGMLPDPTAPIQMAQCLATFDTDGDQDVDLADAAAFQTLFTGSP